MRHSLVVPTWSKIVFGKLRQWLEKNRRWNQDHRKAWSGVTEPGPGGLSAFQRDTESVIREMLAAHALKIESREVMHTVDNSEDYLVLKVADPAITIWVYQDQVNVQTPAEELRLEEWDAKTPEEHRARVLAFLEAQV